MAGIQLSIEVYLEDAELRAKQAELRANNVKIGTIIEANEQATKRSFNDIMTTARTGYMLMAGMARVMGTGMTEVFRTSYQILISAIGVYQAFVALELGKGPAGWVQAGVMSASLATAMIRVYALVSNQDDLSRQMRGVWMGLHGVSSMLGSFIRL